METSVELYAVLIFKSLEIFNVTMKYYHIQVTLSNHYYSLRVLSDKI